MAGQEIGSVKSVRFCCAPCWVVWVFNFGHQLQRLMCAWPWNIAHGWHGAHGGQVRIVRGANGEIVLVLANLGASTRSHAKKTISKVIFTTPNAHTHAPLSDRHVRTFGHISIIHTPSRNIHARTSTHTLPNVWRQCGGSSSHILLLCAAVGVID